MKILSFIIPAYNSQDYLRKCLDSMIVAQLLEKLEIIVVNDGSTDDTPNIAQSFVDRYPNTVRLITQENKGHGGALNTGCAAATGKYLKVVDADDWVVTENLDAYIRALEVCSSEVVLTHHHTIDIGTGEIKNWRSYPDVFGKAYSFEEVMANWKAFDRSLTFHGITYNREFYQKHGSALMEHVYYEDHQYATFPCCQASGITPLDMFIYEYRIGDVSQSVSENNQCKRLGHTEAVIDRMTEQFLALPENAGKAYAAMKIQGLLMSYMTTVLLVYPNRKNGRNLGKRMMEKCRSRAKQVALLAKPKYNVFVLMNYLHFNSGLWNRVLRSNMYNRIRKNHSFD